VHAFSAGSVCIDIDTVGADRVRSGNIGLTQVYDRVIGSFKGEAVRINRMDIVETSRVQAAQSGWGQEVAYIFLT